MLEREREREREREKLYSNGFTLIELSIVLVIIGLLVGGVLVGRVLIATAEIHSVISQTQKYEMAWRTFQLKYNCLAGDCADASSLFTGAINGNGNGIVNPWHVYGIVESLQIWNQLSSAGLIDGKYSSASGNIDITLGITNPSTKINPNIGYTAALLASTYSLQIGAEVISPNCCADFLWGAGFNATVAHNIDEKVDDGVPVKGKFTSKNSTEIGINPSIANTNTTCLSGSNYKLDSLDTGCVMYYEITK